MTDPIRIPGTRLAWPWSDLTDGQLVGRLARIEALSAPQIGVLVARRFEAAVGEIIEGHLRG